MSQTFKSNLIADLRPNNNAVGATSIEQVPSVSTPLDARVQSAGVQHPDISPGECLLGALWRSPYHHHQLGSLDRQTKKFKNVPVTGVDDAVAQALQLSSAGREVYFACAEYTTSDNREAANAAGAYAFWLDIDCGEDKTPAGKGYPTVDDAGETLRQFCTGAELPEPTHIVHSGGGLHVYWVLDREIPREMWLAYARKFKTLTKTCGFRADDSRTADIASVLRVPGTLNFKYSPPRIVSLEYASAEPIDRSVMLDAIAAAHDRLCGAVATKPPSHPSPAITTTAGNADAYGPPNLARLASALTTLDPDCDEETWKLRRLPVSNATVAGLFRSVELWRPTLLVDETDTFIRENDELKGLINAGHTRANAFVLRVVGDAHEPRIFRVWGAKALAGIAMEKHLPDSTMSRAVVLNLRRKLPHETVERLRHAEAGLFDVLAAKLARFADDHAQHVRLARPDLPDALGDRAQDNWEPLLAIAECAGPEWVRRATAAALKLSGSAEEVVSTGNELLADIQHIFETKQIEKMRTTDLIAELVADGEKSWATYNRGKPLSPRQLAKLLVGYDIKSKTVRFGASTPKGYEASQFADAFARYLGDPVDLPQRRNDGPQSNGGVATGVADRDRVAATPTGDETPEPVPALGCSGVAGFSGDGAGACPGVTPPLSTPEELF